MYSVVQKYQLTGQVEEYLLPSGGFRPGALAGRGVFVYTPYYLLVVICQHRALIWKDGCGGTIEPRRDSRPSYKKHENRQQPSGVA